jgi:hypothetical protein
MREERRAFNPGCNQKNALNRSSQRSGVKKQECWFPAGIRKDPFK